jgi:hypothetical protein
MSNETINDIRDVKNPNYSLLTSKDFFGGTDPIRIIIIIYIILSLVLNTIIFLVIGLSSKRKKKFNLPLGIWVMLGVLIMNFFHTFSYFFEWVIKTDVKTELIKIDGDDVNIGGLLVGNPNNFVGCLTQGFLLIFTSISQDFLINIFFYLVNSTSETIEIIEKKAKLYIIIFGLMFPFAFTLFLRIMGALGLNDEFCYVTKFGFTIENNKVKYSEFRGFQVYVMIVYLIRIVNFIFTFYFLRKIWIYVKQQKKNRIYLFKSIFIPILQLFTIGIGVLYRFINLGSKHLSVVLAGPYLILNTADGVLFPIGFALQNDIFIQLKKIIKGEDQQEIDNLEDGDNHYEPMEFSDRNLGPD